MAIQVTVWESSGDDVQVLRAQIYSWPGERTGERLRNVQNEEKRALGTKL